jgi:metallo-beta-lactamase family protein
MCSGGRVLAYLQDFLPDGRTDVLFVGYQARGTLGRELLDGARSVVIEGRRVNVRAKVTRIAGLSAHADRTELLDWLSHVPGVRRRVWVGHGEPDVSARFASTVRAKLGLDSTVPERGAPLSLQA